MDILSIIEKKRFKQVLTQAEINYFVTEYTKRKTIPDYQAAAFLMACAINGLNNDETFFLTDAILHSGKTVDLKSVPGIKIDKHSTGGVGDKVSLILTPICIALGLKVAKISGKGLGHTGGTIDKLESVGVNCNLRGNEYLNLLRNVGAYIMAQTDDLVPADKMIYNLRNATSTVQSLPLIAASIVAKKLALHTDYVFLDVKVGDGGFCPTLACAKELSRIMLNLFKRFKRKAIIHITNMKQPLGRAIGNAIEMKASIDFLNGNYESLEIKDLIFDFVADILLTVKKVKTRNEALKKIKAVIDNGSALKCFDR
jgi:pyrimidine-nucleoside phosphorylase